MKIRSLIIIVFVSLLAFSCGSKEARFLDMISESGDNMKYDEAYDALEETDDYTAYSEPGYEEEYAKTTDGTGTDYNYPEPDPAADIASVKVPDKIIKTAVMDIEVENYPDAIKKIKSDIKKWNGYVSSENENSYGYMASNVITIRVLSKDFENLIEAISASASKVESKNISAVDVSEEFVDIMARLKTKKEVELRYMALLKEAKTVEQILYVEDKIRVIREEIEAKEGRLKFLQDQVAYSTITVEIKQYFESDKNEPGFFEEVGDALGTGWEGFLAIIVGLLYLWPLWLFLAVGLYVLLRLLGRSKRKQQKG